MSARVLLLQCVSWQEPNLLIPPTGHFLPSESPIFQSPSWGFSKNRLWLVGEFLLLDGGVLAKIHPVVLKICATLSPEWRIRSQSRVVTLIFQ